MGKLVRKDMKNAGLYIGVGILAFAAGVVAWSLRKQDLGVQPAQSTARELPLSKELVSRSLQSHSFTTLKLKRNSIDEIIWRWLKTSIANYPQNWIKLNISDAERYHVILERPRVLEEGELAYLNQELQKQGLSLLEKGKRYQELTIYQGNIICPSWSGFIDVDDPRLVYFVGTLRLIRRRIGAS